MTGDELKELCNQRAEEVVRWIYPEGRRSGCTWRVGDLDGTRGKSLGINIGARAGFWKDFSTGEGGRNLVDLYMKKHGCGFVVACEDLAWFLGVKFEKREPGEKPYGRSRLRKIRRRNEQAAAAEARKVGASPAEREESAKECRPFEKGAPGQREASGEKAPEYDWGKARAAAAPEFLARIAADRELPVEFVEWWHARGLIGAVNGDVAFPVIDAEQRVVAAHVRGPRPDGGAAWRYVAADKARVTTHPLIVGAPGTAEAVWVFESQWDAMAVMARLGFHQADPNKPLPAIFITRGAGNGRWVDRIAADGKPLLLWTQNDRPGANGKIPSETWTAAVVEAAGRCVVRRVQTPAEYEDPDAWMKRGQPSPEEVQRAVTNARAARTFRLPELKSAGLWMKRDALPPEPPQIVKGLLHQGCKMIIGGTSKGRKTFGLLDLAISVATGTKWWGYETQKSRVLYLNFELPEFAFAQRVEWIARHKGVDLAKDDNLHVMTLRGMIKPIEELAQEIIEFLRHQPPYGLIIIDPLYKALGDRDENKVGDVMQILNQIERIAAETGAAVAFGHHYAKGNSAMKESIDRMGGSGAFARDPDVILTMTPHAEQDCFTIEPTLRCLPSPGDFVVRWDAPVFGRDAKLDPEDLKLPRKAGKKAATENSRPANRKAENARRVLGRYFAEQGAWRLTALQVRAAKDGVPSKTVESYWYELRRGGQIVASTIIGGAYEVSAEWQEELDEGDGEGGEP